MPVSWTLLGSADARQRQADAADDHQVGVGHPRGELDAARGAPTRFGSCQLAMNTARHRSSRRSRRLRSPTPRRRGDVAATSSSADAVGNDQDAVGARSRSGRSAPARSSALHAQTSSACSQHVPLHRLGAASSRAPRRSTPSTCCLSDSLDVLCLIPDGQIGHLADRRERVGMTRHHRPGALAASRQGGEVVRGIGGRARTSRCR